MKTLQTTASGRHLPAASAQANRCLPFCGLGAAEALRKKAARSGAVLQEQNPLRPGELSLAKS